MIYNSDFWDEEYKNYTYIGVGMLNARWVVLDIGARDRVYQTCEEVKNNSECFDTILIMRAHTGMVLK